MNPVLTRIWDPIIAEEYAGVGAPFSCLDSGDIAEGKSGLVFAEQAKVLRIKIEKEWQEYPLMDFPSSCIICNIVLEK
ncbi:hypothetical protein ADUPG1_011579, partial [Aduncisulcus paluster]